jgi:ATP-dependent Lon protease
MTGEITLRGNVLPVGGIKEKVLAARRAGARTVLIPARNVKELRDVPKAVRRDLEFVTVGHVNEVFDAVFSSEEEAAGSPPDSRGRARNRRRRPVAEAG